MRNLAVAFIAWCFITWLSACASPDPTWGVEGPTFTSSDIPLLFYMDPTARDFERMSIDTDRFYNNSIGYDIMTSHGVVDVPPAKGIVRINADDGDRGRTFRRRTVTGVLLDVEIYLPFGSSRETMIHEKGHVLGLAHDGERTSCMYPDPIPGCVIADNDLAAIREVY